MKKLSILMLALVASASSYAESSQTKSEMMSFEKCKRVIDVTAKDTGLPPIVIADTKDVKMVKFIVSDGDLLVTCSRPDGKMITTLTK